MTPLKSAKKRRQPLHARDERGLVALCFYLLEEKKVNKSCFPSIFQDAELLKIYFKPLVKKLNSPTLVAESDLRFKVN